jgi:hypothetical protein
MDGDPVRRVQTLQRQCGVKLDVPGGGAKLVFAEPCAYASARLVFQNNVNDVGHDCTGRTISWPT